jgi:hypothetical protein
VQWVSSSDRGWDSGGRRHRLHPVEHRSILKNRIHSTLIAFALHRSMSDMFLVSGQRLVKGPDIPEPWRGHVEASLARSVQ